jgi:RNA polymerase primary sigma factor
MSDYHTDGDIHNWEATRTLNDIRNDPRSHTILSDKEEAALGARIRANKKDQDAIDRLVLANVRLVVRIARKYFGQSINATGGDIIAEGVRGLHEAAIRYNPRHIKGKKHTRFSTYSTWWIRRHIADHLLLNQHLVNISEHGVSQVRDLAKAVTRLMNKTGVEPTPEALAKVLGWDVKMVSRVSQYGLTPVSLDDVLSSHDSDSCTVAETIKDDLIAHPVDSIEGSEETARLYASFTRMTDRAVLILAYRFGLMGLREHNLKKVGSLFDCSGERTRQCEMKAMHDMAKAIELRRVMTPDAAEARRGRRRCARLISVVERLTKPGAHMENENFKPGVMKLALRA